MKTIRSKQNQTIYDIAIENYGTCEAVSEILMFNPGITNNNNDFCIDLALIEGTEVVISPDSELKQSSTLRELRGIDITTYDNGENN